MRQIDLEIFAMTTLEQHAKLGLKLTAIEKRLAGGEGLRGTYGTLLGRCLFWMLVRLVPEGTNPRNAFLLDAGSGIGR